MNNPQQNKTNYTPVTPPSRSKVGLILLLLFSVLLIGAVIYLFMSNTDLQKKNEITQEQLDMAVFDLDSMSTELDNRILEIAKLGGNIDTLLQIKNQLEREKIAFQNKDYAQITKISELKDKVDGYKEMLVKQDQEIVRLKEVNEALLKENTGLKVETNQLNKSITELNTNRAELETKVALASKLKIDDMRIVALNSKGKEREGEFRNRQIEQLKIEFNVLENKVAPIEGKEILVRITAPDGNVIFDVATGSGSFMFEGRESFYTAKKEILFDRNTQSLSFLYIKGSEYALGQYKVEVFTESYKMGQGSFTVR